MAGQRDQKDATQQVLYVFSFQPVTDKRNHEATQNCITILWAGRQQATRRKQQRWKPHFLKMSFFFKYRYETAFCAHFGVCI